MAVILIVEDTDSVAPLEIALASLDGLETVTLPNGWEALKFLETESIEIAAVITDLRLPFVDGFELITAIRSNARHAKLPIIVVSGDNHPEVCRRVDKLGANAFFAKPYSPTNVRNTLRKLIYAS